MSPTASGERWFRLRGTVQGVGFRPFVARLARRGGLRGWVRNDAAGVTLCVTGEGRALEAFLAALQTELPPAAAITALEELPAGVEAGATGEVFAIVESVGDAAPTAAVTPDLALCPGCRRELFDPANRRFRYPFINCTNCGPRYSIVRELPYDRPHTTMAAFTMCPVCRAEYEDPDDRRYHAQPNACPDCGPQLALLDAAGRPLANREEALARAVASLKSGQVVAVKGLGGFHLCVDARNASAVAALRARKHRAEKPFAVMFPSLEAIRAQALVDEAEAAALTSAAAPIVLLRRRVGEALAPAVAPGNPWVGAMLPYTPVHALLLADFGGPLVATSANLSEEPLCTDNEEAVRRLAGIADVFLVHDRPIARAVDDSVVRFARRGRILLRRARGFAPTPLPLPQTDATGRPARLCVGGHLKNTLAVTLGDAVVLSPHLGDLGNALAQAAFERTVDLLTGLYGGREQEVVCDAHPDYASTLWAERRGLPLARLQHHRAHVLAVLLEHPDAPDRVLGVAWDGTGYGDDGTIWGGECFIVDRPAQTVARVASLRPFFLPGGESAVLDPRRCLLGLTFAAGEESAPWLARANGLGFSPGEAKLVRQALERRLNAPVTTSAGRLFDGVAALLGLCQRNTFEAQAGMAVEAAAARATDPAPRLAPHLPVVLDCETTPWQLDWRPMLVGLEAALAGGTPPSALAFHQWCAEAVTAVARAAGCPAVALSGGCLQNACLLDLTADALEAAGFSVLLPHHLPPNDNAIAAGQACFAVGSWR